MTSGSEQCECVSFGMRSHPILELCRERRFGEALEISRNEILRTPRDANGYRLMALVLELMGDRKAALSYRDKVVEISPEAAMSYYSRADLFYALKITPLRSPISRAQRNSSVIRFLERFIFFTGRIVIAGSVIMTRRLPTAPRFPMISLFPAFWDKARPASIIS